MDYQRSLVFERIDGFPYTARFIHKLSIEHKIKASHIVCEYFSDSFYLTSCAQKLKLFIMRCMELVDDDAIRRNAMRLWNNNMKSAVNPWIDGSFVDVLFHPYDDPIQDMGEWTSLDKKCETLRNSVELVCQMLSPHVGEFPHTTAPDISDTKTWKKAVRHAPSTHMHLNRRSFCAKPIPHSNVSFV